MQTEFNNLMEAYKKLTLDDKKSNLLKEIKEMISVYMFLAKSNNIDIKLLTSSELFDLEKNTYSDDDYFEATYAYLNILKEIISSLLEYKYYE